MPLISRCFALLVFSLLAFVTPMVQAVESEFQTFGMTCTPPADVVFKVPDGQKYIGVYEFVKDSRFAGIRLEMQLMHTRGGTLDRLAPEFAKMQNGQISNESLTISGEKAIKISETAGGDARTVVDYIALHTRGLYIFRVDSPRGMVVSNVIASFLGSVKFIPFESPWQHLNDKAELTFDALGTFTVNVPAFMRTTSDGPGQLHINATDRTAANESLIVSIQAMHSPEQKAFAEFRDAYSKGIELKLNSAESLKWTLFPGVSGLQSCQTIISDAPTEDGGKVHVANRFGILELGNGNFVQILFSSERLPGEDVKDFTKLSDRIMANIKFVSK